MSPMLPFMNVVARQMGISLAVQGTLQAIILLVTVFAKPLMAAAADAFPKFVLVKKKNYLFQNLCF